MSALDGSRVFITPGGRRTHLIPHCQTINDEGAVERVEADSCDREICNTCQNRAFAELIDI
jgi:hypothetical protein